jgi:P27 family predicted phage terminase small subunit
MPAGRPPKKRKKPSILKYIEGTDKYRGLAHDEPVPDLLTPDFPAPPHLTPEEKKYFDQTVKNLCHMRLMAVVDIAAVERYAQLRSVWDEAVRMGNQFGWFQVRFLKSDDEETGEKKVGNSSETAWMKTVKNISTIILRYESEFGFTPSSRTVLSTDANAKTGLDGSIEAFVQSKSG